jgi:ribonuclease PH
MLPTSTHSRSIRDGSSAKKNDRAVEISRLIGRSLRTVVNLDLIGERTIFIDCDVLQADGSTRTACITGAYLALKSAVEYWLSNGEISQNIITGAVAAVSVGILHGQPLLDLDYQEDSMIDSDYNFVLTESGNIVEIQGTAEKNALSWQDFDAMAAYARAGVKQLFEQEQKTIQSDTPKKPASLFSLQNRLSA